MSTTRNVLDPTANYTPQEKKLNQPVPPNAATASEARPQNALGTNSGVQTGPTLTQQARDGAQMAYDTIASGLSSLTSNLPAASNLVPTAISGRTNEPHYRNKMPHVGGVGDLPGNASETSVCKFPDERIESGTQYRNNQPHVGGVGNLPGGPYETSVAKLPDERVTQGGLGTSSALKAAEDASRAGINAPQAGGMQQQLYQPNPSAAFPSGQKSDEIQGYAGGAGAGANAPFNQQQHGEQGRSKFSSYGLGREVGPGSGATDQGPSPISDHGPRGVTTTSNTLPHHEQATSPESAISDHPTQAHHEDDAQRRGGVTGRVQETLERNKERVKDTTTGMTGTHRDTGARHHDDDAQKRGGVTGRAQETLERNKEHIKDTTPGMTGTHHDTGTRHHDDSAARTEHSRPSNLDSSGTGTEHHEHEDSPTSPSKMDKLKGQFMKKKGQIFKDEEAIRQGENLKTTGQRFPELEHK
ncbi:hypothetical protein FRC02_005483 [Tulasnella sp. 418]|nr:hypothetical protein FRC02_005483 [Tulasnella sp. 418]